MTPSRRRGVDVRREMRQVSRPNFRQTVESPCRKKLESRYVINNSDGKESWDFPCHAHSNYLGICRGNGFREIIWYTAGLVGSFRNMEEETGNSGGRSGKQTEFVERYEGTSNKRLNWS